MDSPLNPFPFLLPHPDDHVGFKRHSQHLNHSWREDLPIASSALCVFLSESSQRQWMTAVQGEKKRKYCRAGQMLSFCLCPRTFGLFVKKHSCKCAFALFFRPEISRLAYGLLCSLFFVLVLCGFLFFVLVFSCSCVYILQPGQDRQEYDRQNRTDRTGQAEQRQSRTGKTRKAELDRKNRTYER